MAEFIKVKRPDDGEIFEVSRKTFENALKERGFVELVKPDRAKPQTQKAEGKPNGGLHSGGKTENREDQKDSSDGS
jgi:hypothetical protein